MKNILVLSDTHSYIDDRILHYVSLADEVWHAGDIGNNKVTDAIEALKPLKAVYGNIDDASIRKSFPLDQRFYCEEISVWMTHIGGYPPKYNKRTKPLLQEYQPRLFICGHSHILKVMNDKENHILHINPGAAGKHGFHKKRTMVRFTIDKDRIKDMEVIELGSK
ncbi:metallophosphatase family protein [Aquimarina sp. ERC-38]|uniref:metallophosphoesterase family protein n=1 Tax=Aquimarina sp. ERC-38 TaxID=2949996 RepID=UPI0022468CFF|nr:metallophosphoesterase family protein [Aquimarina sp. ERC-38]UZO79243.1 metallophosphatase family protein [Aquimarina sp. ERC-38]